MPHDPADRPTRYQESNALLYLIQGDEDAAQEVLDDMLPGELSSLERAASRLSRQAGVTSERKRRDSRG